MRYLERRSHDLEKTSELLMFIDSVKYKNNCEIYSLYLLFAPSLLLSFNNLAEILYKKTLEEIVSYCSKRQTLSKAVV